jgi:hypothetical protein
MFAGQTADARKLYLQNKYNTLDDSKTWKQVITEDFEAFRKAGLDNPLINEINSALKEKWSGRRKR